MSNLRVQTRRTRWGWRTWYWGVAREGSPYAVESRQVYSLWRPTERWARHAAKRREAS